MARAAQSAGRRAGAAAVVLLLLCALTGCAGQKGVDEADEAPPGGGGTGEGGVPVFWKVLGWGTVFGALHAVQQTADGGWVGAGFQGADVHVVKADARGNLAWERRIPFQGGAQARGIAELAGGGYVVAGSSNLTGTETAFLLRVGPDGAPLAGWPRTYGGGARSSARGVLALRGGADGFLAAGYRVVDGHAENVWALRTDAAGAVRWERSDYPDFCTGSGEFGNALAALDGDLLVAGSTGCAAWQPVLLRISATDGAEAWRRAYDGWQGGAAGQGVATAPGGGIYVVGYAPPEWYAGASGAFVLRTDAAGQEAWRHVLGGGDLDGFGAVAAAPDGGFVAAGRTRSYGGAFLDPAMPWQQEDLFLVRGTADGQIGWQKVKGLLPPASDGAASVALAADGGFAVGGGCFGNTLLAKFDAAGGTVRLGDRDLTYTIPAHEGVIRLATAVDVARAAAAGLTRPRLVGGAVLDLLVAAVRGEAPSAFCTGGGTYGWAPAPAAPLVAPSVHALTLDGCVTGPPTDALRLAGGVSVRLDAASGDARTAEYVLEATLEGLAIDGVSLVDSLSSSFDGALRFERAAGGAGLAEVARSVALPAPAVLTCASASATATRTVAVGPFVVTDSVAPGGAVACGRAGEALTVDAGTGALEVTVVAPLALPPLQAAPTSGAFRVRAPDGSRLAVTVTSPGGAALEVDTDGDGVADGALSVPWELLED